MRRIWTVGALLLGGVAAAQPATSGTAQSGMPCCRGQGGPGGGRMAGAGSCCGQMMNQANVTVQSTPDGAIIRLTAKDRSQVAAIQQRAQMMSSCMGAAAPQQP